MGTCCGKQETTKVVSSFNIQRLEELEPFVFTRSNFKLTDYLKYLSGIKEIEEVQGLIGNYRPNDIRCIKTEKHSEVFFTCRQIISAKLLAEISIKITYEETGFHVIIGNTGHIKEGDTEELYFPSSDVATSAGIFEVIQWTYLHKDEEYADPLVTPELNMGRRLYSYVVSLFKTN